MKNSSSTTRSIIILFLIASLIGAYAMRYANQNQQGIFSVSDPYLGNWENEQNTLLISMEMDDVYAIKRTNRSSGKEYSYSGFKDDVSIVVIGADDMEANIKEGIFDTIKTHYLGKDFATYRRAK